MEIQRILQRMRCSCESFFYFKVGDFFFKKGTGFKKFQQTEKNIQTQKEVIYLFLFYYYFCKITLYF